MWCPYSLVFFVSLNWCQSQQVDGVQYRYIQCCECHRGSGSLWTLLTPVWEVAINVTEYHTWCQLNTGVNNHQNLSIVSRLEECMTPIHLINHIGITIVVYSSLSLPGSHHKSSQYSAYWIVQRTLVFLPKKPPFQKKCGF